MQDRELARGLIEAVAQPVIADCLRRGLNGGPGQLAVDLGCANSDVEFAIPFFCAAPRSTTRGVATLRVTTTEEPVYTTVDEALGHLIRGLVRSGRCAPGARHHS